MGIVERGSLAAINGNNNKQGQQQSSSSSSQEEPVPEQDVSCTDYYHAGRSFGDVALMFNSKSEVTVRCVSADAVVWSLDGALFRQLVTFTMWKKIEQQLAIS